jgi:hypothetical protein
MPHLLPGVVARQKTLPGDIEPEKLAALWMPERPFAQVADAPVQDLSMGQIKHLSAHPVTTTPPSMTSA